MSEFTSTSSPQTGAVHRSLVWALGLAVMAGVSGSVAMVIIDPDGRIAEMIYSCSAIVPLALGANLVAMSVYLRDRFRVLMGASIVLTTVGGTIVVYMVCNQFGAYSVAEHIGLAGAGAFMLGIALAHSGGFHALQPARTAMLRLCRGAVVVMVWLFVALLNLTLWMEEFIGAGGMGLYLMMLMILALLGSGSVLGTIIVPLLGISNANRRRVDDRALGERPRLTMNCPMCGHRQTVAAGPAKCEQCAGAWFIEIEEPRCECGYLLFRLTGDSCPECGRSLQHASGEKPT